MAIAQESQNLKKFIAGLLGLLGITILVQGIVIAMHPNDVELGMLLGFEVSEGV